jgi:hypothetical protein
VNPHQRFLLGAAFDGMPLAGEHLADLRKSGLTDETLRAHRIRTVPPSMIGQIAGFHLRNVKSAYLIPFPDPRGGWMSHLKMKVFPFDTDRTDDVRGDHVEERREPWRYNAGARKYVTRRRSQPRLFFPLATLPQALDSDEPVFLVEGEKKALAVAQLGLPALGLESVWSWHARGSRALLDDFGFIRLKGRVVELVPDSDVRVNPMIAQSARRLADALRTAGARPRLVRLPKEVKGVDDYVTTLVGTGAA